MPLRKKLVSAVEFIGGFIAFITMAALFSFAIAILLFVFWGFWDAVREIIAIIISQSAFSLFFEIWLGSFIVIFLGATITITISKYLN